MTTAKKLRCTRDDSVTIDTAEFFAIERPHSIQRAIHLTLSDRSYLPKADDPRSDWVASVAVPAFKAVAAEIGKNKIVSFCTIGTGAALDALAAIEILGCRQIGFTDLYSDIVERAAANILSNVNDTADLILLPGIGDLLTAFTSDGTKFDLIYENLPNIPLHDHRSLDEGQNSATFLARRSEQLPPTVQQALLALHYLALRQAHSHLTPNGRVISSIGGRIPLRTILDIAHASGYHGRILTYTWKIQSEPEDVIGGYANWQKSGFGPFHFYPVEHLEASFRKLDPIQAGQHALEIEQSLAPYRLDAVEALAAWRSGRSIGHTVAVLLSSPIAGE
jgi:hypothetical protein